MKRIFIFICLGLSYFLAGCATATRGSNSIFIVETVPIGAHVTTTVPVRSSKLLSSKDIKKIKDGEMAEPNWAYRTCEPTPCGIQIPRKTEFDILITKEGFAPQIHTIGFKHRKEIARETARNIALAAGTVAVGSAVAVTAGVSGSLVAVGTGAVIGGAAVVAAPVVVIGLIAGSVDASSGANFDFWPNPASAQLVAAKPQSDHQAILAQFEQHRQTRKFTINHSIYEQRRQAKLAKSAEIARAKAARKATDTAKFNKQKAEQVARRKAKTKREAAQ